MEHFLPYDLTTFQWILTVLCGMIIGMSKTGISGAGMIAVPVLATIFGGRPSVGLLLPMLVIADIVAVRIYHRHADWKYVLKLLPWTITGILIAMFVGNSVDDEQFRVLIAWVVIAGILLMLFQDIRRKNIEISSSWWFSAILGIGSGFATMIGNAAGPIMAYYLLSMRLPKNIYIGTGAWFFLIINLFKVPLHIFIWKTITPESLTFDLIMLIPVVTGAIIGYYLVKLIPEKAFRIFIILTTLASAITLF
jgi:uncharacterized membrane protein YfcA